MRALPAFAIVLVCAAPALAADPPGPQRHILQTVPVSGATNEQIVTADVVFPAGARLAYHTHPGEETGVVVSGQLQVEIEGGPTRTFKPGEAFAIPRGVAHQATATAGETHIIATYVVDKDKPLATPK